MTRWKSRRHGARGREGGSALEKGGKARGKEGRGALARRGGWTEGGGHTGKKEEVIANKFSDVLHAAAKLGGTKTCRAARMSAQLFGR